MIEIEMLPAAYGDCLWIRYGEDEEHLHHVLIDTGFEDTSTLLRKRLVEDPDLDLELFVMSHIDEDHIKGSIFLLQDEDAIGQRRVRDAWFNGWKQIDAVAEDALGALQGEYFGALLKDRKIKWNRAFKGGAVVVKDDGKLPTRTLAGGLKITLLSPTVDKLVKLRKAWVSDLKGRLEPGDEVAALEMLEKDAKYELDALGAKLDVDTLAQAAFEEDSKAPNGSSIAFLAEYDGKTMLFAADAHPSVLRASIDRMKIEGKLELDVLKVSHHGSKHNTSPELLAKLKVQHALISSNGVKFRHPDGQCVARLIKAGVQTLHFNYETDLTRPWDDAALKKKWGYSVRMGTDGSLILKL